MEQPTGFDVERVTNWLAGQLPDLVPPLRWTQLAGVEVKDGVIEVKDRAGKAVMRGQYGGTPNGNGQGLKNMKLRAEKIDGEILFTSHNGSGAEITVTIPVEHGMNGNAG